MIVPMKKVCLMIQGKSQNEALLKLREVGVVHLEKKVLPDSVSKSVERKNKIETAMGLLNEVKKSKKKAENSGKETRSVFKCRRITDIAGTEDKQPYSLDAVRASTRPYLPDLIMGIAKERKSLQERTAYLVREITRVGPWGDFSPESVKEMESLGLPVFLYELTHDVFSAIDKDVRFIKISENKTTVRILVLDKELPDVIPFTLPEKSLSALLSEIDDIKLCIEELNVKLAGFSDRLPVLKKEMLVTEQEIEFDNAAASMEKVDGIASSAELLYLTGYVPKDEIDSLRKAASDNSWAFSTDDPAETDNDVPTKLKNNKFVSLLNPITGFLGIVPGYRETDISPWFLLFFCIFFGMLFGDAAYGLIISFIALFGILKTARKGVPQALQMLLLLGVFNTAWGVLTCTWFGVDVEKVPKVLKDISFSLFSTAKTDEKLVSQNLQIFCFSLGLLQLTIAHIKGFFKNIRSLKLFADLGSIAMLWGMYNVVLFLVASNDTRSIPLLPISIYLLGGGFVLTFIFASYNGSVGKSVLESCKNIISVVLGITNVFSDIMSYIRLWAVGLAGASIASTVNTMAGPLLGNFLIFAGIMLLVFGHGLNLILNVLSVLVHGVRLNTLEFSSHIGLTWSGTAYRPFAKREVN
ncbi:MAG: V-type ATP synthase subunit I [Spirochaetes bacterium]|nr:V-type ATP synthase subunit I [Spirochaetota bacterium]